MAYKRISPQPVVEGGTGAKTLTGVLTGNGTSAITANAITQFGTVIAGASNAVTSVAPSATSGVPLISQGSSSNPAYGTAVVAGGGTGVTTMITAYAPVCAGTTATGNLQVASTGLSTSGFVLTSNGASALPSFQAVSSSATGSVLGTAPPAQINSTSAKTWLAPYMSNVTSTQTHAELIMPLAGTISNLYVYLYTNGNTASGTVTVNKNGANTTLVATLTASTTGTFSDTSHSFTVAEGDTIQFEMSQATTSASSGSISVKFVPS